MELATITKDPEEKKKLLTIVVAGGGPTGVEVSGMLADCGYIVFQRISGTERHRSGNLPGRRR